MRVQLRVAGARRAVPERGRHEPVASDRMDTARPAPGDGRRPLHVAERIDDRTVVRVAEHGAQLVVADAEEDAHTLRRRERQIEPRYALHDDSPERLPCGGMLATEH